MRPNFHVPKDLYVYISDNCIYVDAMWYRDEFLNYWWNDKKLYVTLHALDELDEYDKTIDFVCEILDKGKHEVESERERKWIARLQIGKSLWETVYAIKDNVCVIIHLGVKRL